MISLRPIFDERYLTLMMAWRSNPLVYEGFYSQTKPLTWDEHIQFWNSRPSSWGAFIIFYEDRPVGVVTIGQLEHWNCEIGYYIGEVSLWGKGIGKEAVRQGMEWIKAQGKEYCHTTVKKNNERSIRLLKSLGFEYMAEARKNEIWMSRKL